MNNGEELVLYVGTAAADLVEDNGARSPDRRRRLNIVKRAVLVWQREPYQVVEVKQARVVVAEFKPERFGDPCQ